MEKLREAAKSNLMRDRETAGNPRILGAHVPRYLRPAL